jgi:two-component system CheB/CheR fusion protein
MRPYRTVDDKIDGAVITFVDVTERKTLEERLSSLAAETTSRSPKRT